MQLAVAWLMILCGPAQSLCQTCCIYCNQLAWHAAHLHCQACPCVCWALVRPNLSHHTAALVPAASSARQLASLQSRPMLLLDTAHLPTAPAGLLNMSCDSHSCCHLPTSFHSNPPHNPACNQLQPAAIIHWTTWHLPTSAPTSSDQLLSGPDHHVVHLHVRGCREAPHDGISDVSRLQALELAGGALGRLGVTEGAH